MMIKAISFDLWGTIIKSNPEYKKSRVKFLQEYCNHSDEYINNTIDSIKSSFDELIEKHGFHYESTALYASILNELGIKEIDGFLFRSKCNHIFLNYPPNFYDSNSLSCLEQLSKKYQLIAISNTLLIDGKLLLLALNKMGVAKYFTNITFSSDIGVSKPNLLIFKHAHERIGFNAEHILHIGDNVITDYNGAKKYGFNTFLINKSSDLNHDIKYVTENLIQDKNFY